MRNKLFWGVAAAALVMPMTAMAQETTTVIKGTVTQDGAPVAGAQITVTNVPSGTRSTTNTDEKGGFSLPGLRAGGPFTVDVASPQGNKSVTDIYTTVQQDFVVPIELASAAATGDAATQDVVVTASSIARAGSIGNGPATVLNQRAVSKVASVNRDIRDIERRDPLAQLDLSNSRAVSFGGVNPRFNRFTINGVTVGDNFGLNADASPTGRGPIPFDAIGQVSVQFAPYDFRQFGFTGGAVDVVLLAGTNEPHVNGFYSLSTDDLQGKKIGSNTFAAPNYKSETYGATFSGPLIKDRLFYMVSMERNTDPRPTTQPGVSFVPGLTDAKLATVTGPAQSLYGYNPGTILSLSQNLDQKIVGRLDLNITDKQKLTFSFIDAYDQSDSIQNSSSSTSSPAIGLSSDAYRLTELLRSGILQLNSDWTDNFSTEARVSYSSTARGQNSLNGLGFAQFRVCTDAASVGSITACSTGATGAIGSPTIAYGPDISRQTNTLFSDDWSGSFLTRLRMNNHELKLLGEFEERHANDNFLQYSAGGYYFDSLASYNAKNADQLIYAATLNGQQDGATANFHYDRWGFGIQDDWQISDALSLSYGMRYDLFGEQDSPAINPFFQTRYGFPNTETYKGKGIFQPRVSFNYRASDKLRFRGGIGIFGGGSPDIYLSNSFANTILSNRVTFTRAATAAGCTASAGTATAAVCAAALNNVNGSAISPLVTQYVTQNTAALTSASTGALAKDFQLPSSWKGTLSGDYKLFGINLGADFIWTKVRNAIIFTDLRSVPIGTLPDGRTRYGSATTFSDTNFDILLSDTNKGRSYIGVLRASKDFDNGFSLSGSYTVQDVKDVSAATSSTITSNYGYQTMGTPNVPAYGTSSDQTAWRFTYSVGYDHAFFKDYRTVVQLFGETRAGRPYSFTMQDNTTNRSTVFGTAGQNDRYLMYVPTSTTDAIVSYDNPTTATALDSLINSTNLKDYRGTIAAKNIARNRAFTRIDLHLEQEIPTFIGKSRISIFGDIENLPNLLNSNWGGLRQLGFPYTTATVQVQCLSAAVATGTTPTAAQINTSSSQQCVQYRYSSFKTPNTAAISLTNSLYLIRVGARLKF